MRKLAVIIAVLAAALTGASTAGAATIQCDKEGGSACHGIANLNTFNSSGVSHDVFTGVSGSETFTTFNAGLNILSNYANGTIWLNFGALQNFIEIGIGEGTINGHYYTNPVYYTTLSDCHGYTEWSNGTQPSSGTAESMTIEQASSGSGTWYAHFPTFSHTWTSTCSALMNPGNNIQAGEEIGNSYCTNNPGQMCINNDDAVFTGFKWTDQKYQTGNSTWTSDWEWTAGDGTVNYATWNNDTANNTCSPAFNLSGSENSTYSETDFATHNWC